MENGKIKANEDSLHRKCTKFYNWWWKRVKISQVNRSQGLSTQSSSAPEHRHAVCPMTNFSILPAKHRQALCSLFSEQKREIHYRADCSPVFESTAQSCGRTFRVALSVRTQARWKIGIKQRGKGVNYLRNYRKYAIFSWKEQKSSKHNFSQMEAWNSKRWLKDPSSLVVKTTALQQLRQSQTFCNMKLYSMMTGLKFSMSQLRTQVLPSSLQTESQIK